MVQEDSIVQSDSQEKEFTDFYQILLHALGVVSDSVLIANNDLTLLFANVASQNLFGFNTQQQEAIALKDILSFNIKNASTSEIITPALLSNPRQLKKLCNSHLIKVERNRSIPVDMQVSTFHFDDKGPYYIILIRDLSQEQQLCEEISFHQSHDQLTGLVNRATFERSLQEALADSKAQGSEAAVLYVDIDQFKVVNDTCGHVAGDELLRQITELLQDELSNDDILSRLGGDEFGLLLGNQSGLDALKRAEQIRQRLESFLFSWAKRTFSLSASIGVVPITAKSESWASILSQADAACYYAKSVGRNRIRLYTEDDRELAKNHLEMEWVSRIVQALRSDRLQLFAQKVIPIKGNRSYHQEILVRLLDEKGQCISPNLFLSAAERFNLIIMIDRWVIQNTFDWLRTNHKAFPDLGMCTINLSGCSISQSSFLDFVLEEVKTVPGHKVCFEITETSAVQHLQQARIFIEKLKAEGCRFALDDFGTGMSSFAYLKNLPVDYLKIDGAFIKDMDTDAIDFAMVKSINEVAHAMSMKTIAEFVENQTILRHLRTIGVDYAQGFGIDKPKPLFNS